MARTKLAEDQKLVKEIFTRVSRPFYDKMQTWLSASNCNSISELTRKILYKEEIIWYQKDASLETVLNELGLIRKELNAIGNNVNQVTRYFNGTTVPAEKRMEAQQLLTEYQKTGAKVNTLLTIIAGLSDKWLPK